jgi:hypothetical protein
MAILHCMLCQNMSRVSIFRCVSKKFSVRVRRVTKVALVHLHPKPNPNYVREKHSSNRVDSFVVQNKGLTSECPNSSGQKRGVLDHVNLSFLQVCIH